MTKRRFTIRDVARAFRVPLSSIRERCVAEVMPCKKFKRPKKVKMPLDREWCDACGYHKSVHGTGKLPAGIVDPTNPKRTS